MVATVHPLFPGLLADAHPRAPLPIAPVLVELRDHCCAMLEDLARQMLDQADDSLFGMGENSTSAAERRQMFDALRVLRLDRAPFLQAYCEALATDFDPARAGPVTEESDALDILPFEVSEAAEEQVATASLAARLTSLHRPQLADLEQRVQQLRASGLQVPNRLLAPIRLCQAFRLATQQLKADFQIKLVVYKLFERLLTRELRRVYQQAFAILDRHGHSRQRATNGNRPRPLDIAAPAEDPFACLDAPATKPPIRSAAATLSDTLQTLAARGDVADWQATTRRMTAANALFDEALAMPALAPALRAAFEPLRMPLLRAALDDTGLLDNAAHPIRRRLIELVALITDSEGGGDFAPARFRGLLETALSSQADAGDRGLGEALATLFDRLRELACERQAATLARIRREVSRDLELRLIGRELPPAAMSLLHSGMGPLLATRLLTGGHGGAAFLAAEQLLDRLLGCFDQPGTPDSDSAERGRRAKLREELCSALIDTGIGAPQVVNLLDGLQRSWGGVDGPLPDTLLAPLSEQELPDPAPRDLMPPRPVVDVAEDLSQLSAPELLRRLLVPESWFRVFDPAQGQSRWLKLSSYYADADSLSFSGFDESVRQSLRASRLVDDLVDGRSELIDPGATAQAALERLRQLRQPPAG